MKAILSFFIVLLFVLCATVSAQNNKDFAKFLTVVGALMAADETESEMSDEGDLPVPPQLPISFVADVEAKLPMIGKVSGKEYYDYTNQFDRLDFKSWGMEFRTYSFYNDKKKYNIDVTSKSCKVEALDTPLFPMHLPPAPLSQFVGLETIDGVKCQHWRVNHMIATIDVWVTSQVSADGKEENVIKRYIIDQPFIGEMQFDFKNVKPGPLDPSVRDISGFSCQVPVPPKPEVPKFFIRGLLKSAVNNQLITASSAIIKLTADGHDITATWDGQKGMYTFEKVPTGTYNIIASVSGFITTSKQVVVSTNVVEGSTADFFLSPVLAPNKWRAVLEWGQVPRDLDIHVTTDKGCHVAFNKKVCGGIQLDYDVRNGFGPETVTMEFGSQETNIYVFVHNYSGESSLTISKAVVKLYNSDGLVKTVTLPTASTASGRYWRVLSINTKSNAVTELNQIADTP